MRRSWAPAESRAAHGAHSRPKATGTSPRGSARTSGSDPASPSGASASLRPAALRSLSLDPVRAVAQEPVRGVLHHFAERARFFGEMSCAPSMTSNCFTIRSAKRALVQFDYRTVQAADRKQGRRAQQANRPSPDRADRRGHDGSDLRIPMRGRRQRCGGARAGAKINRNEIFGALIRGSPMCRHRQPRRKQADVEDGCAYPVLATASGDQGEELPARRCEEPLPHGCSAG